MKNDAEIAEAVLATLKWNTRIPEDKIEVKVEDGSVMLRGDVEWDYQRSSAQKAVEALMGVRSVHNLINVRPQARPADIQKIIKDAFQRSATIDAEKITAKVTGGKIVLHGKVRSFAERDDAEDAVWTAQGVTEVDNKLVVEGQDFDVEE